MKLKRRNFAEWCIVADHSKETDDIELKSMSRPLLVAGHDTPKDLSALTMGQMVTFSQTKGGWELFYMICRELLGMTIEETAQADAVQVVMFCGWVIGRLEDMNKLLSSIKPRHTSEQMRAGIDKLDFGVFGLIDWYAKRMGIHDHEEVMSVPVLRVYQCLKMDNEQQQYEQRLAKVIREESKHK